MKKIVISIIGLLILGLAGYFLLPLNKSSERSKYEAYLTAEFKKIPYQNVSDLKSIPKLDRPDMAAIQDYYQIIDPKTKTVPVKRLENARAIAKNLESQSYRANMTWENMPCDMGGRTRALMWDPNYENKVWAGSVTGGLWYNNNITLADSSWHSVSDVWENLSISSIAFDPNDNNIYYAGTGEIETAIVTYRESSTKGVGIWKSTDKGVSWELLPATRDFAYVTDVVVKNSNLTSIIFAGVGSGKYKEQNHISTPTDGLYRSVDGGNNWEQVLPIIEGDTLPYTPNDVLIGNDGKIYVGTIPNINGKGGATILISETGDPGSWTVYDEVRIEIENSFDEYTLPGRVVLEAAPSEQHTVYAILASGYNNGFGYYYGRHIKKTTDSGNTWSSVNIPSNDEWATLAWHALTIAIDPNNANHIYIGGLDEYKTSNGGQSWNIVSDWSAMYWGGGTDYIHADQHSIQFKPGSSSEIIFATDGGVFYTNSGNIDEPVFEERNKGYNTLQYYSCDLSPQFNHVKYIGGMQDNGCILYQGEHPINHDSRVSGGDGAFCFFDDNDPDLFFTSVYYNRYHVFVNDDEIDYVGESSGTFVCPADWDGNSILYANGCGFFGDNSDKIYRIKDLPYGEDDSFVDVNTGNTLPFTALNVSQHNNNTLFIGNQNGKVYKVENMDNGNSHNAIDITAPEMPVGSVSCIEIGQSEDTLLVTYSNYGVSSVWLTMDGGASWKDVEGNLPDMPVRWIVLHPENTRQALLATELGVWETHDLLAENVQWMPVSGGLPKVRVDMIKVRKSDNTLLIGTHGRGLFTAQYPNSIGVEDLEKQPFTVYPNPSNGLFYINFTDTKSKKISISDVNGKICYQLNNCKASKQTVDLQNCKNGMYVITIECRNKQFSQKIMIKK